MSVQQGRPLAYWVALARVQPAAPGSDFSIALHYGSRDTQDRVRGEDEVKLRNAQEQEKMQQTQAGVWDIQITCKGKKGFPMKM